jgi:hypothetical protein
MVLSVNANDNFSINTQNLLELYLHQQYDQISLKFLAILNNFQNNTYLKLTTETQHFINLFVKNFLYFFTQPEYHINEKYISTFIKLNPIIANVVAMSCYKNTDSAIAILQNQEKNFVKILILYSCKNNLKIEYKSLFDANAPLACLWYSSCIEHYLSGLVNPHSYENLVNHILYEDERLTDFYQIADLYFGATYISENKDKILKQKLNQVIKKSPFCLNANIQNNPNPKSIAIISCLWQEGHSVYRTLSEYITSLQSDYDLTLIHFGDRNEVEISSFKKVIYLDYKNGEINIDPIRQNDFMAIYYPDIGMRAEGIFLANLRLAPIQMCGTGHPVSTFDSQIDYFISGVNVELEEAYQDNYSERLVLLPGNGAIHNYPTYEIKNIKKNTSDFIINCPWSSQKINYPHVCILREIINKSQKKLLFRFFSGGTLRGNSFIPFVKDLESILGENNIQVIPYQPYNDYMTIMEEGDISIDPYHFGGSNIMSDSLFLRKPSVSFEGKKWYNRIGSQMLREVGLNELITNNKQDYINTILRLIHDNNYRLNIQEKLNKVDLNETIYKSNNKKYFKKAVDYLIKNHEKLKQQKDKKPIKFV